jgi:HSP20 family protein
MAIIASQTFDPVANMLRLQQELDRYLRNPAFHLGVSGFGSFPPVNIFDDGEGTVIFTELPGIDPGSLKITGHGTTLTLAGERKREDIGATRGHHRRERPFGEFSRSLQLPENLDMAQASAKYENGVLRIRIPKAESARPRQIQVDAA